jgi:hypothetical protein
METLIIELTNSKAYKLLQDMEELSLIKVIKKTSDKISALPKKIKVPMTDIDIDKQFNALRSEWQRDT